MDLAHSHPLLFSCLQLLGELLLDRTNTRIMMKYVTDPVNLKLMMILLKDNSRSIQFEAFHVFKVRSMLQQPPALRLSIGLHALMHALHFQGSSPM